MMSNGHKVKLSELTNSLNSENIKLEEKNENAYRKAQKEDRQRRSEEIIKNEETMSS